MVTSLLFRPLGPALGSAIASAVSLGQKRVLRSTPYCVALKQLPSLSPLKQELSSTLGYGARSARVSAVAADYGPSTANANGEAGPECISSDTYEFGQNQTVKVEVLRNLKDFQLVVTQPVQGMKLHWGVDGWAAPSDNLSSSGLPPGTEQMGTQAAQTPFMQQTSDGHWKLVIHMDIETAPRRVNFVLKDPQDRWYNGPVGGNFVVQLKQPSANQIVDQVIEAEVKYAQFSLFDRYIKCMELLDAAELAGPSGMAFVLVWLRLSANRQLPWYKGVNYQSKDISHVQKTLAERMMSKARAASDPGVRRFARLAMATLPRGGGDAEQIRMGILHIMRDHGIREGHRPGIEEKFLEQWHQKLHTNTTAEDVTICEAYLHFLHSGNHDDYWRTLWDRGNISKESLENMDHPIRSWPMHMPHLIPAFQHFLWILKTVHSGADLDTSFEMSKGFLNDHVKGVLYDILANRDAWWVPGRVVEARELLNDLWRSDWAPRDLLLLDIALDNFFGLKIAAIDKSHLSGDDLCELIALVLRNACLAGESEELYLVRSYWDKVKNEPRWSHDWALLAKAALDRTTLALGSFMDGIYSLVQPHAETLGTACSINQTYITNFGEEVVRGHPLFPLSILLQKLDPILRQAAGLGNWQVASQGGSNLVGELQVLPSLASIQGKSYPSSQVILADQVGGMEDIPQGVVAVISASATDVLSHVAIRARNQGVLLAACFDAEEFGKLKALEGKRVAVALDASGSVMVTESSSSREETGKVENGTTNGKPKHQQRPPPVVASGAWVLPEREFSGGGVNQKSGNLAKLRTKNPTSFQLPSSVALPFGTFERVLNDPVNSGVQNEVQRLLGDLERTAKSSGVPAELTKLRSIVGTKLRPPGDLLGALGTVLAGEGLLDAASWEDKKGQEEVWDAVRKVWASKWTDRAWLSRKAQGMAEASLQMACLLQKVIPSQYAFVVHTADPLTGDRSRLFCEVVAGMGEVLVGNYPGQALSFTVTKDGTTELLSLPSKRVAIFSSDSALIARSDSNGEDQADFAGAGLYDSILVKTPQEVFLDYANERLIWDQGFRSDLMQLIAKVGWEVEELMGSQPQDIEGAVVDGTLTVVQSRPQILGA